MNLGSNYIVAIAALDTSVFVMITEELPSHLPAAAIVSTTLPEGRTWSLLFHHIPDIAPRYCAMLLLAESITLPPLTASMKSTPLGFRSSMPS